MSETATTGKPKIKAKELVADIKSGMGHESLMRKYGLSSEGLHSAYDKLIENKLITNAQLHVQHHVSGRPKLHSKNQVTTPAYSHEESEKKRSWPLAVRRLLIVGGCLVGGSLSLWVTLWILNAVGLALSPDYVPLDAGVYVTSEEIKGATKSLADYDKLSHFLEIDDKEAVDKMYYSGSWTIKKGTKVEVVDRRAGTNAVKVRLWGTSYEYWVPAWALKEPPRQSESTVPLGPRPGK